MITNSYKTKTLVLLIIVSLLFSILIPFSSSIAWFLPVVFFILLIGIIFFFLLLKDISYGILLITFLLPFEQIGGFDIFGMNIRLSQIVFLISFIAWILSGLARRDLKIKIDLKLALLVMYVIVAIASIANTLNLFRSIQIFSFTLFVFMLYVFISSYKFNRDLLEKIVTVLFISMTVTCLFGLFQFVGDMIGLPQSITGLDDNYVKAVFGFPRIQSTANEPLNYANYLLLPIGIAFAFFADNKLKFENKKIDLKKASLPLLILAGIVLILTYSRGGWGAAVLVMFIVVIRYLKELVNLKNLVLGFLVIILSFVSIILISELSNAPFNLGSVISRINISDASSEHRVQTIQDGLSAWEKNPLIGIGIGSYGPLVAKYRNIRPEGGWQTVNNEYIEILIETGLLGLTIISSFWLSFFLDLHSRLRLKVPFDRALYLGVFAAFAGMLLQYISFSTLYIFHLWYLIGILNNDYFRKNKLTKI